MTIIITATDSGNETAVSNQFTITLTNDPVIESVTISGTDHGVGAKITVTVIAQGGKSGLTLVGTFNGQTLTETTESASNPGTYTLTYTVAEGDTDVGPNEALLTNLVLTDEAGN